MNKFCFTLTLDSCWHNPFSNGEIVSILVREDVGGLIVIQISVFPYRNLDPVYQLHWRNSISQEEFRNNDPGIYWR